MHLPEPKRGRSMAPPPAHGRRGRPKAHLMREILERCHVAVRREGGGTQPAAVRVVLHTALHAEELAEGDLIDGGVTSPQLTQCRAVVAGEVGICERRDPVVERQAALLREPQHAHGSVQLGRGAHGNARLVAQQATGRVTIVEARGDSEFPAGATCSKAQAHVPIVRVRVDDRLQAASQWADERGLWRGRW